MIHTNPQHPELIVAFRWRAVYKYYFYIIRGEQKGVVTISNKNLLDPLRAVTGEDWIPGKRYRVRGFWVADAKTMCFDLNEGVQEDFRPVTPSNDAE